MHYLHEQGYTTLTIDQYFALLDGKEEEVPEKPILITFDDNTDDFVEYVMPILTSYGMTAVQFTVSGWIDRENHMTSDQITAIIQQGIDVENHTVNHLFLSKLSRDEQYTEIAEATKQLRDLTGKTSDVFAYPYGDYNADTMAVLEELGFRGAFIVGGGKSTPKTPRMELPRYVILRHHTLADLIEMIS
ncbi:hypothetical protein PRECH8_28270 [Insulibacter thermoxylanivorax]|uniref:NodB homology domain-containing protein n=1 Tax=Insulibacter thermoxylanivorax TaxID=2749268 RepID=A0A916VHE0_9BACL|nr:polysaccharide deacetylase family protein [Insulibacter thermoxylanivorax]GFR39531.1 hypothetical protein PRECH8_28270 [Insulibacter thermoxylanivorax]